VVVVVLVVVVVVVGADVLVVNSLGGQKEK